MPAPAPTPPTRRTDARGSLARGIAGLAAALLALAAAAAPATAGTVEYDLVVEEREVPVAGKTRLALTLNGGVPGPTLRFTVGDEAVVRVHNRLRDESTSIHWHGLLLPNAQDGVPYLTTPPIEPGTTHTFRFPLLHAGTYWYHSHTGLQEQRGVHGSLVVAPAGGEPVPTDRDEVVLLSDWTDEDPAEIMRTLMRGSDWYSVRRGTLPTLAGAWRAGRLGAYLRSQWNRMPPMDLSDVAYDAFTVNGKERIDIDARPGETVRLRIINASAATNFFLHSTLRPLTLVAADGPAVEPLVVEGFLVAIAETYDLVVTVPATGRFEIRATAQDGSGHASVFLGSGEAHPAPEIPKADLYSMDHLLPGAMESIRKGPPATAAPGAPAGPPAPARPLSPYRGLRALVPSRAPEGVTPREIELRLTGDMTRFLWSFNGKTLAEDGIIRIRRGEVLRLDLVNDTMMHHPIHLHGHFFRVLDGDDDRAPLKHTVDVPPMGRRLIEFDANETGDWLFHCHVLYHMDAGMARVFSYGGPEHRPANDPAMLGQSWLVGEATVLTRMAMGHAMVMRGRDDFGVSFDIGRGHRKDHDHRNHRRERGHATEYEIDVYAERFFDENVSAAAGWRLVRDDDGNDRAFAALGYRLPLLARARLELDSRGGARAGIEKAFRITTRLELALSGHYDTVSGGEMRAGIEFLLSKNWSLAAEAHSDHGVGVGFTVRF